MVGCFINSFLTLGRTRKFIPSPWSKGEGGGLSIPSQSFWYVAVFWNYLNYLQWKAFDLLNKMRYILWVVALWPLLEACDVTNNGHHLEFYQELAIRLKAPEMVGFFVLNTEISTLHDFRNKICFYCWKNSKMAWPLAMYDVISRTHSNWPLLNLTQDVRGG